MNSLYTDTMHGSGLPVLKYRENCGWEGRLSRTLEKKAFSAGNGKKVKSLEFTSLEAGSRTLKMFGLKREDLGVGKNVITSARQSSHVCEVFSFHPSVQDLGHMWKLESDQYSLEIKMTSKDVQEWNGTIKW